MRTGSEQGRHKDREVDEGEQEDKESGKKLIDNDEGIRDILKKRS